MVRLYISVELSLTSVCVNDNLNDIRQIFDFSGYFEVSSKFDKHRETKYDGDPNNLLGSNCTLQV